MTDSLLVRFFEHNNWANQQVLDACLALSDDQLDACPLASTPWSLREALLHLMSAQRGYLSLLTLPAEARPPFEIEFAELRDIAVTSGEGLLALARDASSEHLQRQVRTKGGYVAEPCVVMLQVVNHATDHRRQLTDMLRALGVTAPRTDSWAHGETTGELIPPTD